MITTKKCSMCAETIPLAAVTCEYCGAQFEVTSTGYCANCHQVQETDSQGCCKVCNSEIIDPRIESRFIEEASEQAFQPVETKTLSAAPHEPNNRMWAWGVGVVVILGIVALGFVFAPKLAPIILPATATPTLTATLVPSATPTPTATRTPRPTATNTPIPAWVNDFVEPILDAIKDRPPDFQDDFSGAQRWTFNKGGGTENGKLELRDGSLQMSVTSELATDGIGRATNSNVRYNDFVLQVDADLSQLVQQDALEIYWRGGGDGMIVLSLRKSGWWQVTFWGSSSPNLISGGAGINPAGTVTLTIISKDTQYAILLDQVPVGYVNDLGRRPGTQIKLSLWVDAGGHTSTVKYSNLKIWDLSKLSLP